LKHSHIRGNRLPKKKPNAYQLLIEMLVDNDGFMLKLKRNYVELDVVFVLNYSEPYYFTKPFTSDPTALRRGERLLERHRSIIGVIARDTMLAKGFAS
jgi:hypothetical protein